jgi:hypothetical protein
MSVSAHTAVGSDPASVTKERHYRSAVLAGPIIATGGIIGFAYHAVMADNRMELRHLRYFVAVAESLHFGEAAFGLGISQPSLSQQIRQLEEELQARLLQRTKRRVELTEAGQLFLNDAREILAQTDRAAMIAHRIGHQGAGKLRVGVGYCMDQLALAKAVSTFSAAHPQVRVELQTMAVTRGLRFATTGNPSAPDDCRLAT